MTVEQNALLAVVADKEELSIRAGEELLKAQHDYLEAYGFTIEKVTTGSFICDYIYRRDCETFIDPDDAMEYAQDY